MTASGHIDPSERVLRSARRRIAIFTLLLVTALVALVGISTAVVATNLMRENIDRTLRAAVVDPSLLHELADDENENEFGISQLGSSDTFVLLADENGRVLSNPTVVRLDGLPDADAIARASAGDDLQDGRYGGVDVRLLTRRVTNLGDDAIPGGGPAFIQIGFVLTLQNAQQRELVMAVLAVALIGLLGAAAVTLLVTRRALVPIRSAFATERRFVAAASHELRTPVAVIRSSAEILERELLVTAEGKPLIADILGESDRLARLVADLLTLASTEAGAVHVDLRALDLGRWFDGVSRRAATLAESSGVRLEIVPPSDPDAIIVMADAERLEQLTHILVENAVEHSAAGANVRLQLTPSASTRTARLTVTDDGPGIPSEERERAFEPFARLRGEKRAESGTGLGLAIARQLAGYHDAELKIVDPPSGTGTTLELLIPLAPTGTLSETRP